jgi:ferrous iron transport protein B
MLLWVLLTFPLDATDHRYSYYGQISAGISHVLEPAGFGTWEASGALLTGVVAKEMVVSTLAQVYHVPQDEDSVEKTTLLEDLKGLGVGLWEATVQTGKELLETLTPGITLFPSEEGNGHDTKLGQALKTAFTPLSAIAYLVFVLLYIPCVSTVGAQKHEFGWRWALLSVVITLVVPWVMSVTVYQVGSLLGFG